MGIGAGGPLAADADANLEIQIAVVVDGDGSAVDTLPDGTPSVQLLPVGPLCFGDVDPVEGAALRGTGASVTLRRRVEPSEQLLVEPDLDRLRVGILDGVILWSKPRARPGGKEA